MKFTTKLIPSRIANIGIIEINNPKALNALNYEMCQVLNEILPVWSAKNSAIQATLFKGAKIESSNEKKARKAFCSGGDVRAIYDAGMGLSMSNASSGGDGESSSLDQVASEQGQHGYGSLNLLTSKFFHEEYRMNYKIATQRSTLPQISLWDGIVMGGGVGASIHGKYRVATENTLFAMPETGIGLFPDVGGMYWLPRLKGGLGQFVALTGTRLKADDLIYAGIATHYIPSDKLCEFTDALVDASLQSAKRGETNVSDSEEEKDIAAAVLMSFHEDVVPQNSFLARNREDIDCAFALKESVEDIFSSLDALGSTSDFGMNTLSVLQKMSPTSLKVTFEAMKRGSNTRDVGEVLKMEYRMSQAFMRKGSDFYEGIRAVLVDKDRNPKWNPQTLDKVTQEAVESYFLHLGENELTFDTTTNGVSNL